MSACFTGGNVFIPGTASNIIPFQCNHYMTLDVFLLQLAKIKVNKEKLVVTENTACRRKYLLA